MSVAAAVASLERAADGLRAMRPSAGSDLMEAVEALVSCRIDPVPPPDADALRKMLRRCEALLESGMALARARGGGTYGPGAGWLE